ncbi:hypothetical protein ASPWEDRAFT_108378 [Aspergillus wentii DTO 134E9]|uniref:Peptidase M20 dimerisation domain-containing protein n=1 Tax=Aspergillus wentii DTO 134E9 TaxID=1073089 RepID=A0A1L9RP73_ASPWE|nr:uncharacterized protein ASPWEDRAFT_108378 [Aspergillus wentii DTO 134E9]OJJ36731.1 hypothetical protein ASPWEDRAFT_108378 [Aspergillus wentii DTO 134E9]
MSSPSSNNPDSIISDSPFLSFHRDIVEIESISGNEHDIGVFVANFLEARNFTVVKQEVSPASSSAKSRFNIYAYPSTNPHPEVLLTSHIDTVPPFIPYALHPNDNNASNPLIAGRGSVDAKASVAAQIFAALDILAENPSSPVSLLFVVGEETGGDGMKFFSNSPLNPSSGSPFHTVVFGEPTELALIAGHKGMLGFEVMATGKAAHSGYPWLGESAISAILPVLARIDRLGDIPAEEGGFPASSKYGQTTVNIGKMDGGVATNVVPKAAYADVAVRLAAGTPEEARDIVRQAVHDASGGDEHVYPEFRNHLEGYAPQDLDTDIEGFNVSTANYGTDVPNLEIHAPEGTKVKRYLYGPGTIHVAHGDNEALNVDQLEEAVRGYRTLTQAALDRKQ